MPAAAPLSALREPARPHPPAAGSEQAVSAARFVGVLSQALEGGVAGGAPPPHDEPSTRESGRSGRSPAAADPAEGPRLAEAVPVPAPVAGPAPAPAPAAVGPVGTGLLPTARTVAVGGTEAGADGTTTPRAAAAREQEEGTPAPLPAVAPPQSAPPSVPAGSAENAASAPSGAGASGAASGGAPPGGTSSRAAGVAPSGGAPSKEAGSVGGRSPAAGSATHAATAPRASVPNTRAPGTGAVEPQPFDSSHAHDAPADAAEETIQADRIAPVPRRTAARGEAASWPEGDPARDTSRAPDSVPTVPAMALVAPAGAPLPAGTARGFDPRDAGPDSATSATTAAPVASSAPAEVARAAPDPRARPEPDPASPEGAPPPGGEAPAAAGVADAPSDVPSPAADSVLPQPAAQPAHAALSRPAESHTPIGHTAPRAAVDQLAPTLVQVAAGPIAAGGHRMVVRLDPAELGKVEVRVERAEAGPAQISLTVDRPETLLLLLRDQPALHRALDQAGVPAEGRTLHFQLAPAAPEGAPATRGAADWGATADGGKGDGTWNGPGHGQGHGGQPGGRHRGHAPADAATHGTYGAWRDAGLDITA